MKLVTFPFYYRLYESVGFLGTARFICTTLLVIKNWRYYSLVYTWSWYICNMRKWVIGNSEEDAGWIIVNFVTKWMSIVVWYNSICIINNSGCPYKDVNLKLLFTAPFDNYEVLEFHAHIGLLPKEPTNFRYFCRIQSQYFKISVLNTRHHFHSPMTSICRSLNESPYVDLLFCSVVHFKRLLYLLMRN